VFYISTSTSCKKFISFKSVYWLLIHILLFSHEEAQVESCTLMEYIYFPNTIFDFAHLIGLNVYLLLQTSPHYTVLLSHPHFHSTRRNREPQFEKSSGKCDLVLYCSQQKYFMARVAGWINKYTYLVLYLYMYCFVIYLFNKQSEPALLWALRECMRSGEAYCSEWTASLILYLGGTQ
jgi:hypothetical protein